MARDSGTLLIKPIKVGNGQTNPLEIQVKAENRGRRSEQDIYLEVDAQPSSPYVQQEVTYTIRLVSAVVTADERLSEPAIVAGEALVEQVGDRKIYTAQRGNKTLRIIESTYSIFPQKSGQLELDKLQALVRVFDTSGSQWSLLSRRPSEFRLTGDPVSLTVRPIPASYPAGAWLPSPGIRLDDTLTDGPYREGEPFTRSVKLVAQGLTSGQLPEIVLPVSAELKAYPDRPVLANELADGHISGSREQRIAYIPTVSGDLVLPAVRIPWWNTVEDRLEYAELPQRVLSVLPAPVTQENSRKADAGTSQPDGGKLAIWQVTAALALLAWMTTLWAWYRLRFAVENAPADHPSSTNGNLKEVRKSLVSACKAGDPGRARASLTRYLQLRFPQLTIDQATARLTSRHPGLADEILALDRSLYGPQQAGDTTMAPGAATPAFPWKGDQLMSRLTDALADEPPGAENEGMEALYPRQDKLA
jgi:hypothetical protein